MLQNPLKRFLCFLISKIFRGQMFNVFIIICPKVTGVLILFALH